MTMPPYADPFSTSVLRRPTTLSARAADALVHGPLDAVSLMRHVCQVPRLHEDAAERMAVALLSSHAQFVCLPSGHWALRGDDSAADLATRLCPLLAATTRAVLDEIEASYPERDLRVQSSGDGDGEWDPDRIAQVVQNLVTNALKYSAVGTAVHVETRGEDGVVILTVHNQGPPILPDALARLFEPIKRAMPGADSTSRSIGLGLYIVKHIVDAHQGIIEVESNAPAGTTFTVRLPKRSPARKAVPPR